MIKWLKATFSDQKGNPSFKRQLAFMLSIILVIAIFSHQSDAAIQTLAFLIGGILGITGIEKFSNASTPSTPYANTDISTDLNTNSNFNTNIDSNKSEV